MTKNTLKVAIIQMNSRADTQDNFLRASSLCQSALSSGHEFVVFPETFLFRGTHPEGESLDGPNLTHFKNLAVHYHAWILAGSVHEKTAEGKFYNTSYLFSPAGPPLFYRKMHLFDAQVGDKAISESSTFCAGNRPALGYVKEQPIGLSICYDLRFSALYRWYAMHGATIICVPSSFTAMTGKAHWEPLLRARAIETQSFILAPNQVGIGTRGVPTYGHSLIIDPWGEILAKGSGDQEEILSSTLDFSRLSTIRNAFPTLSHQHPFFNA